MNEILCKKYKQRLPALSKPPFPGKDGDYIFANVSAQAWAQWLSEQTRLVNEMQLNPLEEQTRSYLRRQLFHFINNEPYDTASGYRPQP